MKNLKSFEEFLNENSSPEKINENFLTNYALKLALDYNVQNAIRGVVDSITGHITDDIFGLVTKKLENIVTKRNAVKSMDDMTGNWEHNKLRSEEDAKEFVDDYVSSSIVKDQTGRIDKQSVEKIKPFFNSTNEELEKLRKKYEKL
jgi:hypothetical protein